MDSDEIFRYYFGYPNEDFNYRRGHPIPDENDRNRHSNKFEEDGPHFHGGYTSPLGIMRQLEEMFSHFGLAEFPSIGPHIHPFEPPVREEINPREEMLKNDGYATPDFHRPWFEGKWGNNSKTLTEDSDLDTKVSENGLGAIIEAPLAKKCEPFFYSSSVSVRTVMGADGKMEEHRTVTDSSGKKETTVRRAIGNESHSVTTVSDADGLKEKREDFVNMDEDRLKDFNEKWGKQVQLPEIDRLKPRDDSYSSIFKKLFGLSPSGSEN